MTEREIYEKMLAEIEADHANYKKVRDRLNEKAEAEGMQMFDGLFYYNKIIPYNDLLCKLESRKHDIQNILACKNGGRNMTTYESVKTAAAFTAFIATWLLVCWLMDKLENHIKKKKEKKRIQQKRVRKSLYNTKIS